MPLKILERFHLFGSVEKNKIILYIILHVESHKALNSYSNLEKEES